MRTNTGAKVIEIRTKIQEGRVMCLLSWPDGLAPEWFPKEPKDLVPDTEADAEKIEKLKAYKGLADLAQESQDLGLYDDKDNDK